MIIGFSPLLRGSEIRCSAHKETINNNNPTKMKINLNIMLLIAASRVKVNAFGMQNIHISRMLIIIEMMDTKTTRLGKTLEEFTIPQIAKS